MDRTDSMIMIAGASTIAIVIIVLGIVSFIGTDRSSTRSLACTKAGGVTATISGSWVCIEMKNLKLLEISE